MDGRTRRTARKKDNILSSARKLFDQYGIGKVSMDEIAADAGVSKVTIYKYFNSKEDLFKEVVRTLYLDISLSVEEAVNTDIPFTDKLKFIIFSKSESAKAIQSGFVRKVIESDSELAAFIEEEFGDRIKKLMFTFFDQGKKEGYIDKAISNEMLLLYIDIFRAGMQTKLEDISQLTSQPETFEQLINMYFFGIIKKRG